MKDGSKWGVCATVKSSAREILEFAAYYLDLGAHRVWIYLDAACPDAMHALKAHPKCRVLLCDTAYWRRQGGKPPVKHQVRQSRNATRSLSRASDVDWLLHVDVDEFLVCDQPIDTLLSDLGPDVITARVRPMEALAPRYDSCPTAFKRFIPSGPDRQSLVEQIYPDYAHVLKGGFLSHVAGKVFVRTGKPDMTLRIHNAFQGDIMNPGEVMLNNCSLAHLHAIDWTTWRAKFDYRHTKGAYRSGLAPAIPSNQNATTLHQFFEELLQRDGEQGLKTFFNAVCADTPQLRARLQAHDLLTLKDLQLAKKQRQHFP